ncbi:MAG: DUF3575 domain-containing protein [Saprospiraceae bacterium]|nr:DUF3575 domain-containing protein [Saprospiraceae bacterium]
MKFIYTLILAFVMTTAAQAQEIKANPIGLLFGNFDIAYEHFLTEDWGVEGLVGFLSNSTDVGTLEYNRNAISFGATGKHYFNPRRGCDRFHVGAYTRFSSGSWEANDSGTTRSVSNTSLALGFFIGQKWVSKGGVSIELGLGAGRKFVNDYSDEEFDVLADIIDVDFFGRLALGYRWASKDSRD